MGFSSQEAEHGTANFKSGLNLLSRPNKDDIILGPFVMQNKSKRPHNLDPKFLVLYWYPSFYE